MRFSCSKFFVLSAFTFAAYADFSYITTVKNTDPSGGSVTKHKIKGNKMRIDTADTTILTDLDAQTLTVIAHSSKSYTVSPLSQTSNAIQKTGMEVKADVKETGQQKKIGGYNCRQVLMNMTVTGQPMTMEMENELWVSADIPGGAELRAVLARMAEKGFVPGAAGPNQKMMADLQKQMAKVNGVPVLQISRMKSGNDEKSKQMQAQFEAMRTQMEAMKKAGGKQAEMADKALANMPKPGGKYLMEVTSESSAFSTAALPASDFAVPAGYKKADR